MVKKNRIVVFSLVLFNIFVLAIYGQKNYIKNPHVVYDVLNEGENYIIHYTFKDHYNNLQNYTIHLPVDYTDSEVSIFGIPQWLFDPYIDNEYNRIARNKELVKGLFKLNNNVIEVDKNAVLMRYAGSFCKPIAEMIVASLEDYGRDTRKDRIEMAMCFVQDIPYGIPQYADRNRHFGGVIPPPGVLIRGFGDCDSKVLLFAGIMIYLIPADEFIFLNQSDHVLSAIHENAVKGSTYIKYKGRDFLLAETAGPGKRRLGEKGEYYRNSFTAEPLELTPPKVIPFQTLVSPLLPYAAEKPPDRNYLVIQNASDVDFRFRISTDKRNWKEFLVYKYNSGNYKFEKETSLFLRIRDKSTHDGIYNVQTGNTYRFSYNQKTRQWSAEKLIIE